MKRSYALLDTSSSSSPSSSTPPYLCDESELIDEDEEETEPWLWSDNPNCLPKFALSKREKHFRLLHVGLWFFVCAVAVVAVFYSGYLIFGVWMPSVNAEFREQLLTGEANKKIGHHMAMSYRPYMIHPYNDPIWLHPNSTHMLAEEIMHTVEYYNGNHAAWFIVFFVTYSTLLLRCLLLHSPIVFLYPYKSQKDL